MEELGKLFREINDKCMKYEANIAKKYKLTLVESRSIKAFSSVDEMIKMKDLAKRMELAESRITRLIDSLVNKGFITRQICEDDRRVILLKLTEDGAKVYNELTESCDNLWNGIWSKIPDDLKPSLIKDLKSVSESLNKINLDI